MKLPKLISGKFYSCIGIIILLTLGSCKKEDKCPNPGYSNSPHLEFLSLADTFYLSNNLLQPHDTFYLSFTDGDADLTSTNNEPCSLDTCNIWVKFPVVNSTDSCLIKAHCYSFFIVDSRDSMITICSNEWLRAATTSDCGFDGRIRVIWDVPNMKCLFPSGPECNDTVRFKMFARDRQGHFSNIIETPRIILNYQ